MQNEKQAVEISNDAMNRRISVFHMVLGNKGYGERDKINDPVESARTTLKVMAILEETAIPVHIDEGVLNTMKRMFSGDKNAV